MESLRVENRFKNATLRIDVPSDVAGGRIRDPQNNLDVGEASAKDPESVLGLGASIEHFEDDLDIVGVEEPEIATVRRQVDGLA